MRAREIAQGLSEHTCKQYGLQWLDNAVFLDRMGIKRDDMGRMKIRRQYRFGYSRMGHDRTDGYVVLLGMKLESVSLGDGEPVIYNDPTSRH